MRKAIAIPIPLLLLLLSGLASVSHGGLFRWVDEAGNIHYTDSIPPNHVRSGHAELSEGGIRIRSVPAAKTPEAIQKDKELERLRIQQEDLLERQRTADRVLLRTFRSEDDLAMARDGKLAAIDVMIDVTKNNIRPQQERLARLLADAANLERVGKPVAQHLSDGIAQAEREIRDAYATIVGREQQKDSIRIRAEQDLIRFRQLKDLPVFRVPILVGEVHPVLHNIVTCAGSEECDRLWEKAIAYTRRHATTAIQSGSAVLLITAPPVAEQDIGLILSRIDDKEGPGALLFLDLQCERSARGKELCQGQRAEGIVGGFRPAITGRDASDTPLQE